MGNKIKEVDELSDDYDSGIGPLGGFNQNNDSGIHKGLSRTKNSLQLHTLNKNEDGDDEENDDGYEGDQNQFDDDEDDDGLGAENQGIPDKLVPEDEPINSDFRRNILEKSIDGDNGGIGAEYAPAASQSPNLKEHLHRDNFFIENFDIATPQHIID